MTRFVYIVEDEAEVRESLRTLLLTRKDLHLIPFKSGDAFVDGLEDHEPGCVLLDLVMPGLHGLEVMERLAARPEHWPTIVLTGYGNVPTAVQAMKLGAVDYLEKPYAAEDLFAALDAAHQRLDQREADGHAERDAQDRLARLSAREREVMQAVVDGCSNKQVAERLGISLRTVEVHRASIMSKLEVTSIAGLVRAALAVSRSEG